MKSNQLAIEIGMVSAIISDAIVKKLYKKMDMGYIATIEQISLWAKEFVEKHKKTDWEEVLDKGIAPLSKCIKEIICWDDACIDWAHYKLEEFKK